MSPSPTFLGRFPPWVEDYLASREAKAQKILRVLQLQIALDRTLSLLDVGCSQGQITQTLAEHFGLVVGVDTADEEGRRKGFHFVRADGCRLPLRSRSFDVLLLNHVVEHVCLPQLLLDEAWRVLRPGGVCYLATPNRYGLMEQHYRLPLLSWLPRWLADRYVRWTGRGRAYLDYPLSYRKLNRLSRRFRVRNQTAAVLAELFHLLGDHPGHMAAAWRLLRSDAVAVLPVVDDDLPALDELMQRYADRPMDFAHATLVHAANRTGVSTVFTIDHNDFLTYRIDKRRRFRIVPDRW